MTYEEEIERAEKIITSFDVITKQHEKHPQPLTCEKCGQMAFPILSGSWYWCKIDDQPICWIRFKKCLSCLVNK